MTTTTLPAIPVLPNLPVELHTLINANNAAVRVARNAYRAHLPEADRTAAIAAELAASKALNAWHTGPAGRAYHAACDTYNAAVDAHNAARANARQARVNAAAATAVRSAACIRCFATHPGEC